MANTIGVIGVGSLGGGMAHRLLDRAWQVPACDLRPERVQALVARVLDARKTTKVLFGRNGAAAAFAPGRAVRPTIGTRLGGQP